MFKGNLLIVAALLILIWLQMHCNYDSKFHIIQQFYDYVRHYISVWNELHFSYVRFTNPIRRFRLFNLQFIRAVNFENANETVSCLV